VKKFFLNVFEKLFQFKKIGNLIGLKALYQFSYIIFNLLVVKKLSIAEYGVYSYVLALITYFSTIPLIGLSLYLQRNVARGELLEKKYLKFSFYLSLLSLLMAYLIMPDMSHFQKITVLIIIGLNCLVAFSVAVSDGLGKYTFQYKMLFFNSLWMIFSLLSVLCNYPINLGLILNYWLINVAISLIVVMVINYRLSGLVRLNQDNTTSYKVIFFDLLLLYSVAIPDAFSRFYDRYLAHHYFDENFLGNYSFNLMIVLTVYALFIRPINSILLTQLSKSHESVTDCVNVIKKYYLFGLSIYFGLWMCYLPFSNSILTLFGLTKYKGSTVFFNVCFINAVLYFISVPFMSLVALKNNGKKKIIYCVGSLLIFNTPLLLLVFSSTQLNYFIGFILAYSINLILALVLEKQTAYVCLASIAESFVNAFKYPFSKLGYSNK
jgi:O-antigen/teichoic acid export membrane protein